MYSWSWREIATRCKSARREVNLPKGTPVDITQTWRHLQSSRARRLVSHRGKDADALGMEPPAEEKEGHGFTGSR